MIKPIGIALTLFLLLLGWGILGVGGLQSRDEPPKLAPVIYTPYPEITPRGYLCTRATGPITIDGKLDDAAWTAAPWSEDFLDIEGISKPKPRFRTRMKMLWDDQYLYIAAELEEPHVWGTLTQHDSVIFHDNDFEVFLDPDSDSHLYGELELNVLNTTWDLLLSRPYKDGGRAIDAWEIKGLKSAIHINGTLNDSRDTDHGWSIEIAWPWKSLAEISYVPCPPRASDQWRINFSRVEWRHEIVDGKYRKIKDTKEDNWVWSPQGVIDMHRPERWGVVQFSTLPAEKDSLRPDPSARSRYLLHRIYYAQRDFHKVRGRWAKTLDELQLTGPDFAAVRLETTSGGYEANLTRSIKPGKTERLSIRADGRIAKD
ncbi:MAG: hypothetical protein EBV06_13415 [Planctomycetia bacterium]|nr:hypothetical protein [Planctomycetia bacterium]